MALLKSTLRSLTLLNTSRTLVLPILSLKDFEMLKHVDIIAEFLLSIGLTHNVRLVAVNDRLPSTLCHLTLRGATSCTIQNVVMALATNDWLPDLQSLTLQLHEYFPYTSTMKKVLKPVENAVVARGVEWMVVPDDGMQLRHKDYLMGVAGKTEEWACDCMRDALKGSG